MSPQGQSILVQMTRRRRQRPLGLVYKSDSLQVSFKCWALYFLKDTLVGICRNGILSTLGRLFIFIAKYWPTVILLIISDIGRYSRSYQILDPL